MIVPTAPAPEGRRIISYAGLVPGEAAMGANVFRGQAGACEKVLMVSANGTAVVEQGVRFGRSDPDDAFLLSEAVGPHME